MYKKRLIALMYRYMGRQQLGSLWKILQVITIIWINIKYILFNIIIK